MARLIRVGLMALSMGLGAAGLPDAASAHHPGRGAGSAWGLFELVFALVLTAVVMVLLILGRGETPRSQRRRPPRK